MISVLIHIFYALCFAAAWAAVLRYDVQMFQQNSYMAGRYWTWLRPVLLGHRRYALVLLPLLCWNSALMVLAGVVMAWYARFEFSSQYKVRLVYTLRVKRLLAVCVALGLLLLWGAYCLGGLRAAVFAAPFVLLLDKGLVLT